MNTTIDQWEVLEAVVELGSFAAAAAKMNRSQSTISYAVSRLQAQFKTPLLEMKGRKAQLTESGKALLADVEPLLNGFRALEQRAACLAAEVKPRSVFRWTVSIRTIGCLRLLQSLSACTLIHI